jgi:hypothetical protein
MAFIDERAYSIPVAIAYEALAFRGDGLQAETAGGRLAFQKRPQTGFEDVAKRYSAADRIGFGSAEQGIGDLDGGPHSPSLAFQDV